jgi:Lysylphosphatidylglycerol synthase TM region
VQHALAALAAAQPLWLCAAGTSFALANVCSAFAWRSAFCVRGGSISRIEAGARYGMGSLVNSLLPGNAGGACRILLFARALPGDQRVWVASGIPAAVGAARAALLAILVLAAAGSGALPAWTPLLLGATACTAAAACIWARHRAPRARRLSHLLEVFGSLGRSPTGALRILGWLAGSIAARVLAVAAVSASLGLAAPVSTALVIVPALAVATLVSLFPAGIGMTTGAVALVLHQRGVDPTTAVAAGLALNAVETVAGLATGVASALVLGFPAPAARRRTLVAAAACACLIAAALGLADFADIA